MSIEETVYLYISYVFKGHEYETAFQREIASLSEQSDEFLEIEMAHKQFLTETFVHLLSEYKDQVKVKDLKTASYIILTIVEAVVHDNVFHNGGKKKEGCHAGTDSLNSKLSFLISGHFIIIRLRLLKA